MDKILVQISFAGNADLDNVRKQLAELKAQDKYKFSSCFLTREMVIEKGFNTDIVDMLDEILGEDHTYEADKYITFVRYMSNIDTLRLEIAEKVNRMFVLDSGTASGVAKEIELFTKAKVILLP